MTAVDAYLAELEASLRLSPRRRARVLTEVREHLEDAVAHHRDAGVGAGDAERRAVADFGPVATVVGPANAAAGTLAMRRAPVLALAAGAAVFGGLLLVARSAPGSAAQLTGARLVAGQVMFFAGMVALELAVVAGVCAAARAAALWGRAEAPVGDRRFVLGAAARSISFALFAAGMWAGTILNGPAHVRGWHHLALLLGLLVMVGGGLAATAACLRLRINAGDEATALPGGSIPSSGVLGVGEGIVALVRRHGVVACAVVAAAATAGAMSHAETSVAGALPWGVAQAAAVVLGFVVLGPSLGLRGGSRAGGGTAI